MKNQIKVYQSDPGEITEPVPGEVVWVIWKDKEIWPATVLSKT